MGKLDKKFPAVYPLAVMKRLEEVPFIHGGRNPKGVVVHYTGSANINGTLHHLKTTGLGYHLIIDRNGSFHQLYDFNEVCWHAKGTHRDLSTNKHYIGISIVSFGKLQKRKDMYYAYPNDWGFAMPGASSPWHMATQQQEKSLGQFLQWCVYHGMFPGRIVGHDEINPTKNDPGGILVKNIAAIRNALLKNTT